MIIVQARTGGTRLHGKVLKEINGKPLIDYLTERTAILPLTRSVVLWAHDFPDVAEDDVAGRYAAYIRCQPPLSIPYFTRVCADSPLLDPMLVLAALNLFHTTGAKLVSNPGYPHGQQVEVVDTAWFLEWEPKMTGKDREHVTLLLKDRAKTGEHVLFGPWKQEAKPWPKLSVDTPEDFARVERIIGRMTRPHTEYGWLECVGLVQQE